MHNNTLLSNPHHAAKAFIVLAMLFMAGCIGLLSVYKPLYAVALIPAMLYFLCLMKKPLWAYFFFLLITFNVFGFIGEDFLQLPGAFKLRDVLHFSLLAFVLISIATNSKTSLLIKSPLNPFILLFMLFVVFIILYTAFEFGVSILSCLRIPRKYLFYLSFFIVMFLIKDMADFKKFIYILTAIGVVSSMIMIVQFLLASKFIFLPLVQVEYQQLGGFHVPRIYLPTIEFMTFLFCVFFWLYVSNEKKIYLFFAVLFGVSVFIGFSRANWFKNFIGLTIPFLFTYHHEKKKYIRRIIEVTCILCFLAICFQFLGLDILSFFIKFFERVESAYVDLINQSGTFGYRLQDSADRLRYFWDKPLFGVGFLHYISANESLKAAFMRGYYVETIDSGIITLVTTMGISGVIVISILSIAFIQHAKKAIRTTNVLFFRGIALGCLGYFIGGILSFITLPFFTYVHEIPVIAIAFAFVEKILQFEASETTVITKRKE